MSYRNLLLATLAFCPHCQGFGEFWKASLDLDRTEINLMFGAKDLLRVTSTDAGNDFTWSSSDTAKVQVSSSGELTALTTGTVVITVKTGNDRRIGQAFVTVPRGQMLTVRGGTSNEAALFNPLTGSFSQLPGLPAISGNGGHAFAITAGPHAGKIMVVHGNASPTTTLFSPGTASYESGPDVPFSVAASGHGLLAAAGKWLIVRSGGSSPATAIYDMATNSFALGPNLTDNAGAGSMAFPITSGVNSGKFMIIHGNSLTTTTIYDPADDSCAAGPVITGGAAGSHSIRITTGASAGKQLVIHTTGVSTSLFDGVSFAAAGSLISGTGNGALTFLVTAGVNAGKYITALGGGVSTTALSNAAVTGFTSGPGLPGTVGSGAHTFRPPTGVYRDKLLLVSNVVQIYVFDDAANSFSAGPAFPFSGNLGLGAYSFEIP